MNKATFDPKGVTSALINRVHSSGMSMMSAVADNASHRSSDATAVEQKQTDFLLANIELENMLKSQLAKNDDSGWKLFVDTVSNLRSEEKPLYRGVAHSVGKSAENVLTGRIDPFSPEIFDLPPYILPYVPTAPTGIDPDFWKRVFEDSQRLDASARDVATNLVDAAALATGAAAAAASAPAAAVVGAFAAGWHVGQAVNDYMGWN